MVGFLQKLVFKIYLNTGEIMQFRSGVEEKSSKCGNKTSDLPIFTGLVTQSANYPMHLHRVCK